MKGAFWWWKGKIEVTLNFWKNAPKRKEISQVMWKKKKSKWVYSKMHSSLLCCVKLGPFSHNKKVYALMVISYWVKSSGQPEKSQFGVLCARWKIFLELIFSSFLSFWRIYLNDGASILHTCKRVLEFLIVVSVRFLGFDILSLFHSCSG